MCGGSGALGIDCAATRMRHHDAAGQEMQLVLHAARQLPVLHRKIFRIADDRMADMGHVSAKLMGAAGNRFERKPGEQRPRRIDDRVIGHGMACTLLAMAGDPHDRFVLAFFLGQKG